MANLIKQRATKNLANISVVIAILLYLLIVVTNVSQRTGVEISFSQWLFIPAVVLVIIAALAALRSFQIARLIKLPLLISMPILLAQAILVGIRITPGTQPAAVTGYLTSILMVHALALTSAVVAYQQRHQERQSLSFLTPFSRLTLWSLVVTFVSMVSGVFVTISGAAQACVSWPLCNGLAFPANFYEWVQLLHRLTVGLAGILIFIMLVRAWKTQRNQPVTLVLATSSAMLYLAQGVIGAALITRNFSFDLIGLHTATATASWAVLIILAVQVGLSGQTVEAEILDAYRYSSFWARLKDYFILTKPIIVLLLLVTTFAGMIVGAAAWPKMSTILWTLLGGALAAGGSSAINQYIDRDLDKLMKRTARRPLASNRLTPAEGLSFGVGLCLLAFYILAVFTNLLAALLSVVGMFYYVWLYSLVLKKMTVQNIVIGGGAGAIPPLVGWAAATGGITISALLLFVIIFLWTPPHFWALALVRIKDYSRGGVPMLPVVRGEKETQNQILIYTIVLVMITLTAPLFGIGGLIYFCMAVILGAWLTVTAWHLWRDFSPKLAWKMYRYSSMYLAFLFLAMVVDALI